MNSLKNKVALITGVSRRTGIGFGIAKRLAAQGTDLFLHAFTPFDKMFSLDLAENESKLISQALTEHGVAVEQMEADFTDPAAPAAVMQAAADRFGHIDILILNHTHDGLKTLDELTAEEIDRHLSVNVRAALLLVQQFARQHDSRPGGRIIMLTSGQHLGPMPHTAYVASKGALHQLTCSLADTVIEKRITVNTVNPGPVKTYQPNEETDAAVLERMPRDRWGEPDDVARLIVWLVSDDAEWITGQVINSEGGFRR